MSGPQTITLDGKLTDAAGTNPLLDASVVIDVKIFNPSGTCILYDEHQTVDTTSTEGRFTLLVGSVTGSAKRAAGIDPGNPMVTVFSNQGAVAGSSCTYTPAAGDTRVMRVTVSPSTTGTVEQLSPDTVIDSVPFALMAESLQGLDRDHVLAIDSTSTLNQTNVANVFSAINYPILTSLLAGTNTSYVSSSASGGAKIPSVSSAPSSPVAGQIWFNSSGNSFQYYNGTSVQTLGVAGSGISTLSVGSSLTSNGIASTAVGSGATLDLADSGVAAGTYPKVTVSSKGLVTYGTGLSETDVPTLTTPGKVSGSAITSGTIGGSASFYSSGNVTTPMVSSGVDLTRQIQLFDPASGSAHKITISAPTLASDYTMVFPATAGSFGYALTTDGSGNLSWANVASNTLPSLATGKIWVGNSSSVATAVTPNGDVVLSIAGSGTVTGLQGYPVSSAAPTLAGQILRWNGTAWMPNSLAMSDLRSTVTGTKALTSCTEAQTLVFNSITDSLVCSNIQIADSQIMWGSTGANLVFAGPATGGAASPTFRSLTAADLPAGSTSQWNTVSSTINYLAGAVGIGTATPQAVLDVYGTGSSSAMLVPRDTTTARPTGINGMLRYNTSSNAMETFANGLWTPLATGASGASQWTTNASNIYYNSTGNVGIGTVTPSATLDINGNAIIEGSNSLLLANANMGFNSNGFNSMNSYSWGDYNIYADTDGSGGGEGFHIFSQAALGSGSPAFTVTSGKIGIGTNAPQALLDIASSSTAGTFLRLTNSSSGGRIWSVLSSGSGNAGGAGQFAIHDTTSGLRRMTIDTSGNMGIGTTSPQAFFDVNGSGTSQSAMLVPRDTTAARPTGINGMLRYNTTNAQLETYSSGAWAGLATGSSGGGSSQWTTSGPNIFYNSTGNVGVGTTTPAVALDVNGAIYQRPAAIASMNNYMQANGSGAEDSIKLNPGILVDSHTGYRWGVDLGISYVSNRARTRLFANTVGDISFAFHAQGVDPTGQTSFTDSMVIRGDTGNVGVGTSSPQAILDVNGSGTSQSAMIVPRDSTAARPTGINGMLRYNTTNAQLETYSSGAWAGLATGASVGGSYLPIAGGTMTGPIVNSNGLAANPSVAFADASTGFYSTGSGNISASVGGVSKFSINLNGSVGIGTATTSALLDVFANQAAETDIFVRNQSAVAGSGAGVYAKSDTQSIGMVAYGSTTGNTVGLSTGSSSLFSIQNTYGSGGISFKTAGSAAANERMRIDSSGNVGVGTMSPLKPLHVYSSNNNGLELQNSTAGQNSILYQNSANQWAVGQNIGGTNSFDFYSGSILMSIAPSGNVGVGTTLPQAILDVNGSGTSQSAMLVPRDSTAMRPTGINGMLRYNTTTAKLEAYTSSNWASLDTSVGSSGAFVNGGNSFGANAILGTNDNYNLSLYSSGAARMTVLPNGNIGIGTSAPAYPLDVAGGGRFGGSLFSLANIGGVWPAYNPSSTSFVLTDNLSNGSAEVDLINTSALQGGFRFVQMTATGAGNNLMNISGAGNVGIGTIAPNYLLSMYGSSSAVYSPSAGTGNGPFDLSPSSTISIINNSQTDGAAAYLVLGAKQAATTTSIAYIGALSSTANNSGTIVIGQRGSAGSGWNERMRIDTLGSVGVGTTSPQAILDVNGSGTSQSAMIVPRDSTAARPTGINGMLRYNTTNAQLETYSSGAWAGLATGASVGGSYLPLSGGTMSGAIAHSNGTAALPGMAFADTTTGFYSTGAGNVTVSTNGVTRLTVSPSGFVGIGTTLPVATLELATGSTGDILKINTSNLVGSQGGIKFQAAAAGSGYIYMNRGSAYPTKMIFGVNTNPTANTPTDGVVIDGTSGTAINVGIGTTSPSDLLEVATANGTTPRIRLTQAAQGTWALSEPAGTNSLQISQGAGSGIPYLTILGSGGVAGNVGIGTTSPATLLSNHSANTVDANGAGHSTTSLDWSAASTGYVASFFNSSASGVANGVLVKGAGTASNNSLFSVDSGSAQAAGGSAIFRVLGNGNVGVGTTSPQALLDVYGTGPLSAMIVPRDSTAARPTGINGMLRYNTTNAQLETYSSGAWAGLATSAVGGGTSQWTTTGSNIYYGSGSVGIGTNSPGQLLTVGSTGQFSVSSGGVLVATSGTFGSSGSGFSIACSSCTPSGSVGNYSAAGSYNSKPYYQLGASSWYLWATSSNWFISAALGNQASSWFVSSTASTPPAGSYGALNGSSGTAVVGINSGTNAVIDNAGNITTGGTLAVQSPGTSYITGSVGVGTTSPGTALELNVNSAGTTTNLLTLRNSATGTSTGTGILFGSGIATRGAITEVYDVDLQHKFNFGVGPGYATPVMTMTAGGNVGVGTTSPQAILDINGSGTSQSAMIVPRDSTAMRPTGINGMLRYNTTNAQLETYSSGAWAGLATSASGSGSSQWTTNGSNIYYGSGNVGIGTNTPTAPLHITSTGSNSPIKITRSNDTTMKATVGFTSSSIGTTNPSWSFGLAESLYGFNIASYDGGTQTTRMYIDYQGNVGVGTTSPQALLDISGSGANSAIIVPRATIAQRPSTPANGMIRYQLDNNTLEAYTGGAWSALTTSSSTASGTAGSVQFSAGAGALAADSTNYVWDNTNKRLGIGVSTPARSLHVLATNASAVVHATQTASAGDAATLIFSHTGWWDIDASGQIGRRSEIGSVTTGTYGQNPALVFRTSNNSSSAPVERVRIDSAGNVGVGTTSPQAILDVNGSGTSQSAMIVPRDSTATRPTGINGMLRYNTTSGKLETFASSAWQTLDTSSGSSGAFMNGGNAFGGATSLGTIDANSLALITSNSPRLFISSSGNVGIGTNAPLNFLSVNDSIANSGTGWMNSFGNSVRINNAAGAGSNPGISFASTDSDGNAARSAIMSYASPGAGAFYGGLQFYTRGPSPATARLTIDSTGNVGIGTASPANRLDVSGAIAAGTYAGTATSSGNIITSGSIGIGSAAPSYPVHLLQNVTGNLIMSVQNQNTGNNTGSQLLLSNNAVGGAATIGGSVTALRTNSVSAGDSDLIFQNSSGSTMNTNFIIKSSGNVGIGTTTPNNKLSITTNSLGDGVVVTGNNGPLNSVSNGTYTLDFGLATTNAYFSNIALSGDAVVRAQGASSNGNLILASQNAGGGIILSTGTGSGNDTIKAKLTNAGLLGVGTTSPQALLDIYGVTTANSAIIVPRATIAQRPSSPVNGMIRYQIDTQGLEAYTGGAWSAISTAASSASQWVTNGTSIYYGSGNVGIGTTTPNSNLQTGSFASAVVIKTAAYTIGQNDSIILANATAGTFAVTLPSAVGVIGRQYSVKKTDSSTNAVTINTSLSQTIDNLSSVSLATASQFLTLVSDGSNWNVIGGVLNAVSFAIPNSTGVAANSLVTSSTVTSTGTGIATLSVSGSGSPLISVNGGAWASSAMIIAGQTLSLQLTSSNSPSTTVTASVTGGTAVVTWNVTTASCSGVVMGGACWYLGAANTTCSTTCSGHGGFDSTNTRNYAGDLGTNAQCNSLLTALGVAGTTTTDASSCMSGVQYMGCHAEPARYRCTNGATDGSHSFSPYQPACACVN